MTEHTPGPWRVERQEDLCPDGNGYIWAIKAKRKSEEKNVNGGWKHYVQNPAYANSEANARLIASAPALLAALQVCDEFFKDNDDFSEGGEFPTPEFIQDIRNAIAKATS